MLAFFQARKKQVITKKIISQAFLSDFLKKVRDKITVVKAKQVIAAQIRRFMVLQAKLFNIHNHDDKM